MDITSIKLMAWVIYALAGAGIVFSAIKLFKTWHPSLRNMLVCACIGIIFIPWQANTEQPDLAPAFMVTLFDGLSHSPEAALRAGAPLLLGSLLIMILGQVAGLLLGSGMSKHKVAKNAGKASKTGRE